MTEISTIDIATMASGFELKLHVHKLQGAQPGPRLGIMAVEHGDEILPIEVIRQVLGQVDPATLKGSIWALPVANPHAFEMLTRNNPIDMLDLVRWYPGGENGWVTEKIAHKIIQEYWSQCDYMINFHSGGAVPSVEYQYLRPKYYDYCRAFGMRVVRSVDMMGPPRPGGAPARPDIPTVTIELGGGHMAEDRFLPQGVRGCLNILKHVGMLPGKPELPPEQLIFEDVAYIRPAQGGLLYPGTFVKDLGTIVPKGHLLGTVVSPYTFRELERIEAPYRENVIVLVRNAITKVHPGDFAYMCGDMDTAHWVKNE
jgi:predicted deacylase